MQRVLMVLTSHDRLGDTDHPTGWYVPEAAHPWASFSDADIDVEFVSPLGGSAPMVGFEASDTTQVAFLEQFTQQGPDTMSPDQVDPTRYDAVFYVGGHGTMWDFPNDEGLRSIAESIDCAGGVVAAVCHGPAGLVNLRNADGTPLVSGKRVAAFTNAEEAAVGLSEIVPFLLTDALVNAGAIPVAGRDFEPNVVVDGRLVTGQNPASARGVGDAVVALVAGKARV